jgi:protein-tyrosine phosphatase
MASRVKFQNILNFRDVGTTINSFTNTSTLQPNLLYRSARPDTATLTDRSLLTTQFHIKTIIDLRSKTEHINVVKAHSNTASLPPAVTDAPNTSPTGPPPLNIPTVQYHYISLNGPSFERYLVWSLSWFSLAKLLSLTALGYRDSAIAILGREVMTPRGLVSLGLDTLDHSTREIKNCFDILSQPDSYPVMVHCTQGKDRTGLIILLILLLCGVGQEAAEQDYVLSAKELEPENEERLKDIRKVGLDDSFVGCPPDFVEKVIKHLDDQYGGVEKYLSRIGVDPDAQHRIRDIMVKNA